MPPPLRVARRIIICLPSWAVATTGAAGGAAGGGGGGGGGGEGVEDTRKMEGSNPAQ